MRRGQVDIEQAEDGAGETLRLAQREMEDGAQQQTATDGGISVLQRPAATSRRRGAKPLVNGILINPEGKASAFDEG